MQKLPYWGAPDYIDLRLSLIAAYPWLIGSSVSDDAQWDLVIARTGPRPGEIPILTWPTNLFSRYDVQDC
jgi:hypothetical protein